MCKNKIKIIDSALSFTGYHRRASGRFFFINHEKHERTRKMKELKKERKVQLIKCKCGKIFAACIEPDCYTDKVWLKNMRKYVIKGCSVEMASSSKSFRFEKCTCNDKKGNLNQVKLGFAE